MSNVTRLLLGFAVGFIGTSQENANINSRQPAVRSVTLAATVALQGRNTISGHVFGVSGRPMPDVYVELLTDTYSTLRRMRTNASGFYTFSGLSEGYYKVRVLPYGTDYLDATRDVTIINISAIAGSGATNEQADFYLRLKEIANAGPFAAPGAVFVQEVPEEAKKLYEKGLEELRAKKEKEGFGYLRSALEIFPSYYLALERLGTEYAVRGRDTRSYYEAARILLTKAVEVNPRGFSSRFGLGFTQYHLGQTAEAVENLRQAVNVYDKSINGHLWLGIALKRTGKLEQAEVSLKRANELSKGKAADVHWQLAGLYSEQKRYGEAADALELYLKNEPDARDAEKIRQVIKQLREKAGT